MARTNTEITSELPVFVARRSTDYPAWALVTCPRDDCGQTFIVKMSAWFKTRHYGAKDTLIVGRSCPYCMKVGRLPDRNQIV